MRWAIDALRFEGKALLLYGALAIVAGLVEDKAVTLNSPVAGIATVYFVSVSFIGALMDYAYITIKLLVVK